MKNVDFPTVPTGPIAIIELAAMVDRLAALKALIAPMQEEEAAIKDALKATGMERIDGSRHTAVVSLSERETIDTKALKADHPLIAAQYSRVSLVETLKLTARKTH